LALKIGLDSNVLVETVAKHAPRHKVTADACARYRDAGAEFVLAEHAILEAFSVLSRAPEPLGVPPLEAYRALSQSFGSAILAPVRAGLGWEAIRHTLLRGYGGGRVYDTIIALAVREAGAEIFLTWNIRHFLPIAPVGLEIREPR
jgi:predicted nucleic acid-binding protein